MPGTTCTFPEAITGTRVISYTYDPLGRLVEAAYSGGECYQYGYDAVGNRGTVSTTLVYTYNGDGLRAAQRVSDTVTTFVWDAGSGLPQVLATSDGALDLYGLGRIGEARGGRWRYALGDALGSITFRSATWRPWTRTRRTTSL